MTNNKQQRVTALTEEICELLENHDGITTLDAIDALTAVTSTLLTQLKQGAREGVAQGIKRQITAAVKQE